MSCIAAQLSFYGEVRRTARLRDETVATPWNIYNKPVAIAPVVQRATQCGYVDREVGRLDKYVRPNPTHQFLLADQLAWSFKQNNQDFQSATAKAHRLVSFEQKKLCWE